jgi:uncharacterized protein YdhG (YjbR/CyaY superfamily)
MKKAKDVESYINAAPKEVQAKLKQLRKIVKMAVPKAEERISYGMPYYGYRGRLAYFAAQRNYIGLYIPPPIIAEHEKELRGYVTTKSAVHFPNDKPLPVGLIRKLVFARKKWNEAGKQK